MKRSWVFLGTMALTLAIGVAIGQVGSADSGAVPGSADDPVVTKSYVDAKVAAAGTGGGTPTGSTAPVPGIDTFKVVPLNPGQILTGGEGTEVIVRTGQTTAIASANGGLSDLTGGADLAQGAAITNNHMLLIPRNDGRGLKVGSAVAYVLVRGTYTVK